jgi:hypothetical protein
LATNDWTTLFQTVLSSPDSYLVDQNDVFCFASGTSVYHQIFPANHIAFGYSAISEHWLSRKPCDIPGEIWSPRATGKARGAWAAQAKADWYSFCDIARWKCNHPLASLLWEAAPISRATAEPKA